MVRAGHQGSKGDGLRVSGPVDRPPESFERPEVALARRLRFDPELARDIENAELLYMAADQHFTVHGVEAGKGLFESQILLGSSRSRRR